MQLTKEKYKIETKNLDLSVFIEADRFFYGMFSEDHTLVAVCEPQGIPVDELYEVIDNGLNFRQINLIVSDEVLHLPENLAVKTPIIDILQPLDGSAYNFDTLIDQRGESHYFINPLLNHWIEAEKNSIIVNHISSLMAEYLYPSPVPKVFAIMSPPFLYIQISDQNGLRFYNKYFCENPSDFLYFLTADFEINGLDPERQSLELAGRISENDETMVHLRQYFKNIYFSEPMMLKADKGISLPSRHYFMDLYLGFICA